MSYLSSGLHFDSALPVCLDISSFWLLQISACFSLTAFPFDTFVLNRYFSMELSIRPALFYSLF